MDLLLCQLAGSSIFVVFAILTFRFAAKTRYQTDKGGKFFPNEILIGVLYLLTAIMYPFFYSISGISVDSEFLMYLSTIFLWIIEIGVLGILVTRECYACRKNPLLLDDRDYEKTKATYRASYKYDTKKDFKRKILHFLAVIVIIAAWELGQVLGNIDIHLWGMSAEAFYRWMCITIGLGFVILFAIADFVRLFWYAYLPPWANRFFMAAIRNEELVTFITSVSLVLGFVPFIFAPYQVFLSVALITSLADAAASLVGKHFGKHHLSPSNEKTFEGLFAGGFATFLVVALAMSTYPTITIMALIGIATIAASLFMVVDLTVKNFSDNIVNSLACGAGMVLFLLLA